RRPFNFGEWPLPGPAGPLPAIPVPPAPPTDPSKRDFLGSTTAGTTLPPIPSLPMAPTFTSFNPSATRPADFAVVAQDAGGGWVRVFDFAAGVERFRFEPFAGFTGGVRVATADVTGDG